MLDYTPRRTFTIFALARSRHNQDLRELLQVIAAGSRGDEKMLDEMLDDLDE